ncbi:hypothetical protein [Deinococcus ruber]|uniref:Uncharacterized protein n=1 Tax=Deinococcus ruber TaxID=1848197 RepID=A0A918CHV3_9DEIO|nr:hypothetical protein [Deinococcus ruber]GGR23133.1 hypothetical protein GCM10008957_38840 [Deinococcus ruber]
MALISELVGPLAALTTTNGRNLWRVAALEIAALDSQQVTLIKQKGRKSAWLIAAEQAAITRAAAYAKHLKAREHRQENNITRRAHLLTGHLNFLESDDFAAEPNEVSATLDCVAKAHDQREAERANQRLLDAPDPSEDKR